MYSDYDHYELTHEAKIIEYPKRAFNLAQTKLFKNNYHMMHDYYAVDDTKRIIRKHIQYKYGRHLPLTHRFGIEYDQPQLEPQSVRKSVMKQDSSKYVGFQKIKSQLPKAMPIQQAQIVTKTGLLLELQDLPLAQNHSLYQRIKVSLQKTEKWEKQLKDRMRLEFQRLKKTQQVKEIQVKPQAMSVNFRDLQIGFSDNDLSLMSEKKRALSHHQEETLMKSDFCKMEGKHLILLKNIFAN